jgi:hypothetical protein
MSGGSGNRNMLGFHYGAEYGNTWRYFARNNTTCTSGSTGVVVTNSANDVYTLRVRMTATDTAYFSVNGGTEFLVNTNTPAVTTDLGYFIGTYVPSASAPLKREIRVGRYMCTHITSV